jgi:hypothetical protein
MTTRKRDRFARWWKDITQSPKEKDQLISQQPPTYRDGRPAKAIPSTQEYVLEASKDTLNVLKSAAELVPVPLLKEVLGLGVTIIEICQVDHLILSTVYER